MLHDERRKTPEELLNELEIEERRQQRGKLKVFLGYSSGVGKSFRMLDEGRRRSERGEDVVICALQPGYPPEVLPILETLEMVPTLKIQGAESIDLERVIDRRPGVALIDGLAYDNPPGSRNPSRWQDVEQLLEAGISVLTTINIQYLENVRDEVEKITGLRTSFTIPWEFLHNGADEISVVDAPSEANEFSPDADTPQRLAEKHKLSRLREIALLIAASVVDRQLEGYLRANGAELGWGVQERILVCLSASADAASMLESARRNANRFQGALCVAALRYQKLSPARLEQHQRNLELASSLGAEIVTLSCGDCVESILDLARQRGITQIFIDRSATGPGLLERMRGGLAIRLIQAAEEIDVVVYPQP